MLDFAVDHAEESQRNVKLNHEGVDHDQITQRHAPIHHTLCGAPEHGHQPDSNDQLLAGVEQAQGALAFDGGAPVALQVFIVTPGFKIFVIEVLDRLVVEQRINRTAVG